MTLAHRHIARPVPGYRACSACEEEMDLNAAYNFCQGVRCICTNCAALGFKFAPDGSVIREEV